MKKGLTLLISGLIIVSISLFSCNNNREKKSQKSIIETIQQKKVIRIGMSTFVPWAMKDKAGKLVGFEIDVAKKLAEDMGVEVQFVPTSWSGIIPALLTGKFDVIIGGMGITPNRNLKVNFSNPYDYTGLSILAHRKKAAGFKSLADFNRKSVIIAVRIGTTAELAAKKFMPNASFRVFENESQAILELSLGRVHGVVASAPLPQFQALKHPDKFFIPLRENFTKEPIGFALRKGDSDALNFFNNWIGKRSVDGFLAEKKYYWFNTNKWEKSVGMNK